MKNPERVAELLAELRTLAENDFERAVVSRCEKDLSEQPAPVIIDDDHQSFNGIVYKKNHSGHFAKDTRIHQAIWAFYYGEIPEGYQIHHIDENKNNNAIKNLQCVTASEHAQIHHRGGCRVPKKIFVCDVCGKEFEAQGIRATKYCSAACTQKAYRARHPLQTLKKTCPICGKGFSVSTACLKQKCCSRACGYKLQSQTKKARRSE